jgi:hypothetical protein
MNNFFLKWQAVFGAREDDQCGNRGEKLLKEHFEKCLTLVGIPALHSIWDRFYNNSSWSSISSFAGMVLINNLIILYNNITN